MLNNSYVFGINPLETAIHFHPFFAMNHTVVDDPVDVRLVGFC